MNKYICLEDSKLLPIQPPPPHPRLLPQLFTSRFVCCLGGSLRGLGPHGGGSRRDRGEGRGVVPSCGFSICGWRQVRQHVATVTGSGGGGGGGGGGWRKRPEPRLVSAPGSRQALLLSPPRVRVRVRVPSAAGHSWEAREVRAPQGGEHVSLRAHIQVGWEEKPPVPQLVQGPEDVLRAQEPLEIVGKPVLTALRRTILWIYQGSSLISQLGRRAENTGHASLLEVWALSTLAVCLLPALLCPRLAVIRGNPGLPPRLPLQSLRLWRLGAPGEVGVREPRVSGGARSAPSPSPVRGAGCASWASGRVAAPFRRPVLLSCTL